MSQSPDILELLRRDIVAGELPFGSRLRIDELATRYGVSHMPIREALRELHGEGLVIIEKNRGARVREFHQGLIEDLFDIRSAIETMLARRAAERRTEENLEQLRRTEEELEELVARKAYNQVPGVNRIFHGIINEAAGNPGAIAIVDRHWQLMAALWEQYNDESRFPFVIDEHRRILRAIERKDAVGAAVIMAAHVERAKEGLLSYIADDPRIAN